MALSDAVRHLNLMSIDDGRKEPLRKMVEQIYADMQTGGGGGVESVTINETLAPIDNQEIGNLVLSVDNTDPLNPVINLVLVGE